MNKLPESYRTEPDKRDLSTCPVGVPERSGQPPLGVSACPVTPRLSERVSGQEKLSASSTWIEATNDVGLIHLLRSIESQLPEVFDQLEDAHGDNRQRQRTTTRVDRTRPRTDQAGDEPTRGSQALRRPPRHAPPVRARPDVPADNTTVPDVRLRGSLPLHRLQRPGASGSEADAEEESQSVLPLSE